MIVIVAVTICLAVRPLDSYVTTGRLMTAAKETNYILCKVEDEYFEIQGTDEFAALFEFNSWQQQKKASVEEPVLILRFAEAWIAEFFSDGTITAHYGYASNGTKPDAHYLIPLSVSNELISYIETHGVQREFGDGAIGSTTFHK